MLELFTRGRKVNISIVFITQPYSAVPKDVKLSSTHFLIMKTSKKQKLQQIAFSHSSDIDFKDFMNLYKNCTVKLYSFSVNNTTVTPNNSFGFRLNPLAKNIKANRNN